MPSTPPYPEAAPRARCVARGRRARRRSQGTRAARGRHCRPPRRRSGPCARRGAPCVLLKLGRDPLADPASERVGMDVPLDAPELAAFTHHAVADDAVAIADDAHVPFEVELRPLALQIGLRERALAVQRRLERRHDLGHCRRVGGEGAVKPERAIDRHGESPQLRRHTPSAQHPTRHAASTRLPRVARSSSPPRRGLVFEVIFTAIGTAAWVRRRGSRRGSF
jgi:hypothetical protein